MFIEQHPDSISGVSFWVGRSQGPDARFLSYPGSLHQASATLSVADGHAAVHRWQNRRTRPPVSYQDSLPEDYSPNNPDVAWLQERTCFPELPEE